LNYAATLVHSPPSGTVIDRNSKTIYQVLSAGKPTVLEGVNMGYLDTHAKSSRYRVTRVKGFDEVVSRYGVVA